MGIKRLVLGSLGDFLPAMSWQALPERSKEKLDTLACGLEDNQGFESTGRHDWIEISLVLENLFFFAH
jgi:hypothetical protein